MSFSSICGSVDKATGYNGNKKLTSKNVMNSELLFDLCLKLSKRKRDYKALDVVIEKESNCMNEQDISEAIENLDCLGRRFFFLIIDTTNMRNYGVYNIQMLLIMNVFPLFLKNVQ